MYWYMNVLRNIYIQLNIFVKYSSFSYSAKIQKPFW